MGILWGAWGGGYNIEQAGPTCSLAQAMRLEERRGESAGRIFGCPENWAAAGSVSVHGAAGPTDAAAFAVNPGAIGRKRG